MDAQRLNDLERVRGERRKLIKGLELEPPRYKKLQSQVLEQWSYIEEPLE